MSLRLPSRPLSLGKSLSARLLLLTIVFVMVSEVLIYAPSIGRFRLVYLEERLAAGRLAILALRNGSPQRDTIVLLQGIAEEDGLSRETRQAAAKVAVGAHLVAQGREGAQEANRVDLLAGGWIEVDLDEGDGTGGERILRLAAAAREDLDAVCHTADKGGDDDSSSSRRSSSRRRQTEDA